MKNIIYSAMITLAITFAITAYSESISSDLENGLIRLHVIANSDNPTDQQIKLAVRDKILETAADDLTPQGYAEKAAQTANTVLEENGFNYGASAQFCTTHFPKKEYKELTLPKGKYKAVRVVLGEGKGKNWWCVLYPPVCMADTKGESMSAEARALLKKNLEDETYNMITGDIKVKFRIVEIIDKLRRK